ncbi:hypothetical protein [Olleya sp. R77988]|uniref:hypothetical protein n=1 Tax=Olleya sp. R77988 TaxID=3093875 RepID=UPI0037C70827
MFDFYIEKHNLLIEYDGHQHTTFPNAYHKTESEFELCKIRDHKKTNMLKAISIYLEYQN